MKNLVLILLFLAGSIYAQCLRDTTAGLNCACGIEPRQLVPLTTVGFLYPSGNEMPATHRLMGELAGASVRTLDAFGNYSLDGKIYVVAEGMSNALRVFDAFKMLLATSTIDNSRIRFVNNGTGGMDLEKWVHNGVGAMDVRVQIALLYHCLSKNFDACDSKAYADTTAALLKARVLQLKLKYPNLKQVFVQAREFGGWKCLSAPGASSEPAAHRNGFGVKNFVNFQIAGDVDLNYTNAPFIAWSIYPWDANTPRSWFETAGLHPCPVGATVWAQQWFNFLLNDSTTRQWFAANP